MPSGDSSHFPMGGGFSALGQSSLHHCKDIGYRRGCGTLVLLHLFSYAKQSEGPLTEVSHPHGRKVKAAGKW